MASTAPLVPLYHEYSIGIEPNNASERWDGVAYVVHERHQHTGVSKHRRPML